MLTTTIYQPHYGPQGQPYTVRITLGTSSIEVPCWTQEEAQQIRDDALDAGHRVRILGLPMRGCCVLPTTTDTLSLED